VLGQLEAGVEDVVAGNPAGLDAVGAGQALLADGVGRQVVEVLGAEGAGGTAADPEAGAGHAAGKKAHGHALPGKSRTRGGGDRGSRRRRGFSADGLLAVGQGVRWAGNVATR